MQTHEKKEEEVNEREYFLVEKETEQMLLYARRVCHHNNSSSKATKHTHEYVPYIHNQTHSRHMCQVYIDEQGMNPLKNVCGQIILAKIKNCERDKKAVAFAFAIAIQLYRVY